MAIPAFRYAIALAVLLLATMFTSASAHAQVGTGGDAPKVTSGSASTMPNVVDLVRDPAWQKQEATWQGVRYMEINNAVSGVRVSALQIDATSWVIQTDEQSPVTGRMVYRDNKIEVIFYRQSDQDRWIVRPAE
jgi:hypothetical protein